MGDTKTELELEAIEELEDKTAPAEPLASFRLSSNHNETLVRDLDDRRTL